MALDRPSLNSVKKNVSTEFDKRRAAIYGLAIMWAATCINDFRERQMDNEFWDNQTTTAMRSMFTSAFLEGDAVGFLMAHAVSYGVYLELANNGEHQAIKLLMKGYSMFFMGSVRKLYDK